MLVAGAMATSSIVFSEPAVADALMMAVICGVPVLGAARFGHASLLNFVLWLVLVGTGLAAVSVSTTFDTALTHQLVTLFLAVGAFVLAGYIAADPEPRYRVVMAFYVVGCLAATVAALVGYFNILPSTYDLFTNYGRARGTFKDPNVYAAALPPAIVFLFWTTLRGSVRAALLAACVALVLSIGLLISFSRGAWASAAFSLLFAGWLALVTTRRTRDYARLSAVAALGGIAFVGVIGAALQMDTVSKLFEERASLDQSYDEGPEGRFGGQAKARALILDHPFGIGTHTFRDTYHPEEAHNVYLSQFLNAGWLGGLCYAISVFGTLGMGLYAIRRRTALQGPIIVATASFAGLVFEGFVIDTDHWRHFFIAMALIWGLVDADAPPRTRKARADD
jgi:O-antigen ligase